MSILRQNDYGHNYYIYESLESVLLKFQQCAKYLQKFMYFVENCAKKNVTVQNLMQLYY